MVLQYAHQASLLAKASVDLIKNKLVQDSDLRQKGETDQIGFAFAMASIENSILNNEISAQGVDISKIAIKDSVVDDDSEKENGVKIVEKDNNVVEMINDEDEIEVVKSLSSKEKQAEADSKVEQIEIDDDSEEEVTEVVGSKDLKAGNTRDWYKNNKWKWANNKFFTTNSSKTIYSSRACQTILEG